jgi:hypothetical protein
MAQPAQTQVTFPSVPATDVGRVIEEQIQLSDAVKAVATRNQDGTWKVVATRPTVGRGN